MPKVLLADDSTHAQRMGTRILAGEGIEVVTVSNGEAAAKKLAGEDFDLVLADIFMPGRTGYEVCSLVKRSPKLGLIPVVLVVGQLEPYDPDQGASVGADAVLKKPFEASIVIKTVKELLQAAASRRAAAPSVHEPASAPDGARAAGEHDAQPEPAQQQAVMEVPVDMADMAMSVDLGHAEAAAPDLAAFGVVAGEEPGQAVVPEVPDNVAPSGIAGLTLDLTSFASEFRAEQQASEPAAADAPVAEAPVVAEPPAAAVAQAAEGEVLELAGEAPAAQAEAPAASPAEEANEPFQFESVVSDEQAIPAAGMHAAAAPAMARDLHWQASTEAVASEDRAVFAAARASEAVERAPRAAAVHEEWADLLATVEEPPATHEPAAIAEAPAAVDMAAEPEAVAAGVAPEPVTTEPAPPPEPAEAVLEPAPGASEPVAPDAAPEAAADAAAPAEQAAAPPLDEPVIIEADVLHPDLAADAAAHVVEEAAVAPNEAELRQAIDAGLNKALPGITAYPGLVDRVMEEVLARLGSHLRR